MYDEISVGDYLYNVNRCDKTKLVNKYGML